MSGRHPAHDVLADLAAEVLADGEARVVEAHVIGCPRCADLLADAERVRQLLMTADPGPMPAQVWDRIAFSLAQESLASHARQVEHQTMAGSVAGQAAEPTVQEATTGQWEQFAARTGERHAAPDDALEQVAPAGRTSPAQPPGSVRPIRRGAPSLRSRRQIRSEDRTMSLLRYVRPLGIAAAVLVLAGAAGLAVVKLPLGGSGSELTTAAGGDGLTPSAAEVDRNAAVAQEPAEAADTGGTLTVATGANYTEEDLAARAGMLTPVKRLEGQVGASGSAPATSYQADLPPSVSGNASLTDPVKLAECLAELNAGDDVQPIAVDFARYEGQDAAIIVIAARSGEYEVWAVARTCGAGSGGQLAFQTFSP